MNMNHIILINLIRPTRVNYSKMHNHMWLIIDTCTCMHNAIVLLLVVFKSVRHVGEVADSDLEIWEGGGGQLPIFASLPWIFATEGAPLGGLGCLQIMHTV